MSSLLPYFKWFPADAETNSEYCSMTYAERGLYHHCLNVSWINDGLPSDLGELSRVLRISKAELEELWPRVSKCFREINGKLINPRQEEERGKAIQLSERNKRPGNANASREKRDSFATTPESGERIVPQRAYESGSISVSDSSLGFKEENKVREIPKTREVATVAWPSGFDFEIWITERDRKHPIPGKPQIAIQLASERIFKQFQPAEFDAAHDAWCDYWKSQNGGIPTLAVFISEAWWRKLPPKRAPPEKESWTEGIRRDIKENIERTGKPW